jgi:hypothetical protein
MRWTQEFRKDWVRKGLNFKTANTYSETNHYHIWKKISSLQNRQKKSWKALPVSLNDNSNFSITNLSFDQYRKVNCIHSEPLISFMNFYFYFCSLAAKSFFQSSNLPSFCYTHSKISEMRYLFCFHSKMTGFNALIITLRSKLCWNNVYGKYLSLSLEKICRHYHIRLCDNIIFYFI